MSSITEVTKNSQEQFLAAVKQSQKAVVDAVAAWAKVVETAIPAVPAGPKGLPGLPKPQEVVETSFDYADKLLKAQRDFAKELISAAAPVLEKAEKPAPAAKA
jgi:hypothetical protein